MNRTKALFLFLALILPTCVFIFLKFFGRNEFEVKPLFIDAPPTNGAGCQTAAAPYTINDSVMTQLDFGSDSLMAILFSDGEVKGSNQTKRIEDEVADLPLVFLTFSQSDRHLSWKQCVFFLSDPLDLVIVDRKGRIRGQYVSTNREEVDRFLTEVTIILKRY
jgi:hypothetical protein